MGSAGLRGRCRRIDVGTCLANPFPGRLHAPLSLSSAHPLAFLAWLLSGIYFQSFDPACFFKPEADMLAFTTASADAP